jgi:hypothetical protein
MLDSDMFDMIAPLYSPSFFTSKRWRDQHVKRDAHNFSETAFNQSPIGLMPGLVKRVTSAYYQTHKRSIALVDPQKSRKGKSYGPNGKVIMRFVGPQGALGGAHAHVTRGGSIWPLRQQVHSTLYLL